MSFHEEYLFSAFYGSMKGSPVMNEQNATTQTNLFNVSDQDFEEKVLKSTMPVIVDFWAEWCVHCRALAPVYERLSNEYAGKLRFTKLDAEESPLIPARYAVRGLPTLLIFKDGKEIGRLLGPHPSRLPRMIECLLADAGV
jgi:thioredoxin 1